MNRIREGTRSIEWLRDQTHGGSYAFSTIRFGNENKTKDLILKISVYIHINLRRISQLSNVDVS